MRTAELFHEALAREPEQQLAFLKKACAGDTELFRKLKELLDSYAEVITFEPDGEREGPLFDPDTLIALGERYGDIKPIGRGGMGLVLRAYDRELDKVVALKMLHPALADDERAIERFRNEIRLSLDITHKNVCRTYGLERVDGEILIAMEYVEGDTLRSVLDRARGVSVPQALRWAAEICDGLTAAHDKGIVHRDLKPGNIMIDRDGHAKVMDFGIAGPIEAAERTAGTVMGTPQYMSPEQARGRTVGPASDIYSLGLLLYELFTGDRRDPEHPVAPSDVNPYLPDHIDSAILKCLQDEPKRRFQTASQLIAALTSAHRFDLKAHAVKLRVVVICALLSAIIVGIFLVRKPAMRHERVNTIAFSSDGRTLASASEDATIKLWDVQSQREKYTLTGHHAGVSCLAFSADGRWLASGSDDMTVRIWKAETGQLSKILPDPDQRTLARVALNMDGTRLASETGDTISIWDVKSGRVMHVVVHKDQVNDMAFSPDGGLLASGDDHGNVKISKVETGQLERDLSNERAVTAVAFSPDGQWLASGGDRIVKLWSRKAWVVDHLLFHKDTVQTISFSRDGQRLASLTADYSITLWMAPSWEQPKPEIKIEPTETEVAFIPNLHYAAVAHIDGAITLTRLPVD